MKSDDCGRHLRYDDRALIKMPKQLKASLFFLQRHLILAVIAGMSSFVGKFSGLKMELDLLPPFILACTDLPVLVAWFVIARHEKAASLGTLNRVCDWLRPTLLVSALSQLVINGVFLGVGAHHPELWLLDSLFLVGVIVMIALSNEIRCFASEFPPQAQRLRDES